MSARDFLILDDNASERRIMAHILSDAFPNASIRETGDANEAMVVCENEPLDCLLLDYNMPQTDGVAFAEKVRAHRPHLPMVLVTGVGDEMLVAHAIRHGVNDYIPKGRVNIESIQRTVERAVQSCSQTRIIEEQREELENFAYALAHDFKQPIRQIRTFSQIVTEEALQGDTPELRQHLGYLDQAARRLSNLVDVMSQYTLLNQPPALAPVRVGTVFDSVHAALAPMIAERNAEVTIVGADISVHGNDTLLGQVLQNLIANGLKYNKSAIPSVSVIVSEENDQCRIAVKDNGIGMDTQYHTEIFRPLVRLHTHKEYEGAGLGLTLARKAMVAQNGSIWCESTPGEGSTFFLKMSPMRVS